ncbi:MAG: DoxX-like family protein [Actinomycetota bacterium]|nr:DoxX-like family protein [Actinomycetota bacterium]
MPSAAVAGVWLYHGLWCKVLGRCADQLRIVADLPGMPRPLAKPALVTLGLAEITLSAWVISGRRPRQAALAETALLTAMNGGGLAWGRRHIAAPKALLAENLAFLALVWWAANNDR